MKNITFEEIRDEHLESVLKIYTHYVLNTTATFHAHALSLDEMREIVFFTNPIYKTFVIMENETIVGYVILTQHKKREAYNRTAEVTIYLKPDYVGKGIGSKAVQYIEDFAKTKGIHALVATICGENSKSINLFSRNGYFKCAHYKEVGMKFGIMLDIVAYQKILD
ncbi:MAG: N-acetyltransferase family protein [Bacillota bacterium]|nr:N-acetyltransferase family protein [Bacillota bacterium]